MARIGILAKTYRGAAGSSASTEMKNIRDLTVNDERGEADISNRGSEFELIRTTMRKVSFDFQMNADEDDADYAAILAAYVNRTPIAWKCLSAADGSGIDCDVEVLKLTRNEALRDAMTADVTVKPTYHTRYPEWVDAAATTTPAP